MSSGNKPQRGAIQFVSFDYALSGLDDIAFTIRRALPCAIDYALSELVTHLYSNGYGMLILQSIVIILSIPNLYSPYGGKRQLISRQSLSVGDTRLRCIPNVGLFNFFQCIRRRLPRYFYRSQ
jgi:hypothetical protein